MQQSVKDNEFVHFLANDGACTANHALVTETMLIVITSFEHIGRTLGKFGKTM